MTPSQFRKLALQLPEAVEGEHHDHPDFRVGGKIFATIGPDATWGMVKLKSELQTKLVRDESDAFSAFPGKWGEYGATKVVFEYAPIEQVEQALLAAWRNVAPKKMLAKYEGEDA
ncbi:MAG: MmcQ/YjbR family DNA-binding protein [Planctomycetota bacterium]